MRIFGVVVFVILLGVGHGREIWRQKRQDGIFAGLGKVLNSLLPSNNQNGPQQPPIDPNSGKAQYCNSNPADCEYLNCLAENFQRSENSNNLKMGGKLLTDPALRKALQSDPTVSQAACDKIGLNSQGCDGFKQFLGLIDRVSPGDGGDPRDPNRGKRQAGRGTPPPNRGNTPSNQGNQGNGNGPRPQGSSGSGKGGKGTVDYTDYYDHGGHGSGSGSGAGGDNGPGYVPKDCSVYLPNKGNNGNNGNRNGNNNGGRNQNNGRG